MGIKNGSQCLYAIKNLSLVQLCLLAAARAAATGRIGRPCVALDFSWLCFKLKGNSASVMETKKKLVGFVSMLSSTGCFSKVIVVLDPDSRHHSKKATIVRDVKRDKSIMDAIKFKAQIISISRTLRLEQYDNIREKDILMEKRKDLEKKVKTCESTSLSRLSPEFICQFQADSMIQGLLHRKEIDIAIGNDSDFSFVAGPNCLQVTEFKLEAIKLKTRKRKNSDDNTMEFTIKNITVACGFPDTILECCSTLSISIDESMEQSPLGEPFDRTYCGLLL